MVLLTEEENIVDEKTVCALGLFDGVHLGHRLVIGRAAELAKNDMKTAVFTFDSETVTSKGRLELLLDEEEKRRKISELGADYIYSPDFSLYKDLSAEDFVRKILVGKLNCGAAVCGKDYRFGREAQGDTELLSRLGEKYGFKVASLDKLMQDGEEVSSSVIREHIRKGEIERANALLGYTFGYRLKVEHGNELGRTWNFPTINQVLPEKTVLPEFGVYCSRVTIDGKQYVGVTNIGVKPTVNSSELPLAETYIVDFDGDLYGRTVEILLDRFVRPERKFDSFEELKAEIGRNVQQAKEYFSEQG